MALHLETREALIAFVEVAPSRKRRDDPMFFLERTFGVGTPGRVSQGNKDIARHERSRAVCLAGLEGVVIQTEEQRRICGADNMVPVHRAGDPSTARFCIDVFEFPNRACELPVVWSAPIQAKEICALEGKRLCQQEEWMLSCRADPGGGADRVYAYGDELDLEVCNTNKRAREGAPACDPKTARSAFETCATDTEPSGSFPGCRSRFGVFDQHGNVAEIMTRLDADGHVYTQLKGSAFFYRKVARTMKERPKKETYPDHCGHDPRWHVEPIERGWHVNYHLGFRCCKSL